MNKFVASLIITILILGFTITVGCSCAKAVIGGVQNNVTPSIQSKGENSSIAPAKTQNSIPISNPATSSASSGGTSGDLWSDIPIYNGANQVQRISGQQAGGSKDSLKAVEWRFFETSADVTTVSSFYQTQMPTKGWTKTVWMDMGPLSQGTFQKNSENRECLVQVAGDQGKTTISIMSGSK
jgi:hypothetical protein